MKSFFAQKKIAFVEKDISLDREAYHEWRDRWHGDIVPLVVFADGKRVVDGYEPKTLNRILHELGYQ